MAKPWKLTRQAEASLTDIAAWTLENFGPRQADAYEADLIERCDQIASGDIVGQECSILLGSKQDFGLRFARAGQHFVVFLENSEQILIVDFLHAASDLPRRLEMLRIMRGV